MECKKLMLIQMLLVGVAVAQTGQQQTFSLSDPQLQQVRPVQPTQQVQPLRQVQQLQQVQQVRQPPVTDVFQRALQHQQPQHQQPTLARSPQAAPSNVQTFQQENQSFQFINTRSQVPSQGAQGFQATHTLPEQGRVQSFSPQSGNTEAQRSPLTHSQPPQQHPVRTAPVMTFQQVPVEVVSNPLEQHDAQVFSRRPPPGSHNPAIAVAVQQPQNTQVFFRQPAPAPAPTPVQPPTQEIFQQQQFQQQQFQEQPLPRPQEDESLSQFQTPESQQDFQRFQQGAQQDFQATRTRPSGRSRGPPAVPVAAVPIPAARRPVPQQQTVVRTARPTTLIQVADGSTTAVQANDEASDELFREQAENAKYTFTSAVDDRLTDNSQVRQETRDGLNLSGLYSYSDGFYRRTVHYEADQNGYRVTKEDVEPIGDGPRPDPAGSADVSTQVAGADVRYTITADDIRDNTKQQRQLQQQQQQQQFQQGDFSTV